MDFDMDTSPSYFNPENLSVREQYRRYGKRQSDSSLSPYLDNSSSRLSEGRRSNTALFLEDIKQEADKFDFREGTPSRSHSAYKRGTPDGHKLSDSYPGTDLAHRVASYSLKACKIEDDVTLDAGETTFASFASLLDSALQDEMSFPDLILQFEKTCRDVSESVRYGSDERHRIVEDRLTRQKAQFLLDEAASWSLLWYLYGKGNVLFGKQTGVWNGSTQLKKEKHGYTSPYHLNLKPRFSTLVTKHTLTSIAQGIEEIPEDLNLLPTTSHLEACQFVSKDITAQSCLRIVQWLEGLASNALDLENKVRGSHVGTYIPSSGIWHNTQRHLRRGSRHHNTVSHLDFDAPTRENALPLPDDRKSDETLLEDIWTLLCAGRLDEARDLCRSAGQAWRAATLTPFGGLDYVPSIEALKKNGRNRILQAIELESGLGRQWHLWKWASYCASERIAELEGSKYETAIYAVQCSNLKRIMPICRNWESACWAMCKSWLDIQVDMELTQMQPGRTDQVKSYGDASNGSPMIGDSSSQQTGSPESWPLQVLNQQPRDISSLLQKLHSGEIMNLMLGHIHHLLDLIWSWISPLDDNPSEFRLHGDPQMIRFGAHLVLVLRYMCGDHVKDEFKEKMMNVGDLIVQMYTMFLFSKQQEELVGLYASKLARHRCIDIFVHMMELRLNASLHVKYKLFLSAMEYLPFSPGDDDPRGSFAEILERVLLRSRDYKIYKYDRSSDAAEQHRLQSLEKAMVIQWFCFTPPSTVVYAQTISDQLLLLALAHWEFALISMWRVPALPIGAHKLLSFLAECLKQRPGDIQCLEDHDASDYLREFKYWREYYSCDATYRNWLKLDLENAEASPLDLSLEEKQRFSTSAKEMLSSSLSLLQRKEDPWLILVEDHVNEAVEYVFIELHATAMLCLPSGECMTPDATVCATLMSALYSSVLEDDVRNRQLTVNVMVSSRDSYCIEVGLCCLAVEHDGLGPHDSNDGGILAAVMAAGFKGELARFQAGVTMEISQLDAWYTGADGTLEEPATYIVRGLCRRCCLPELVLRSLQVSISLVELGEPPECHNELLELVACPETGFLPLFSQQQLQELLMFEREYSIREMELLEQSQYLIAHRNFI
ncbi:hypothetical protein V2J09_004366 [Rumex salicifolius]